MAIDVRTYETVITIIVATRQSMARALEWVAPLGEEAAPLLAGLRSLHDEAYEAARALDELAQEEYGKNYRQPTSITLDEATLARSRQEGREYAEVQSPYVRSGPHVDGGRTPDSAGGAGGSAED